MRQLVYTMFITNNQTANFEFGVQIYPKWVFVVEIGKKWALPPNFAYSN